MRFTDLFIRRPVLSIVVSLLIFLIGFRAILDLPIRQFPKLSSTVITVSTTYPGASSELMQGFITTPLEQAIASAEGIDYMTSNSVLSQSTITVYLKLNYDPTTAMADVMAKVNQVKYLIPREAFDPVITKSTGQTFAIMYINFTSNELNSAQISDYITRVVQPTFSTVEGVASSDILGGQTFAMRLWLDPARMAARGITGQDISAAISANNFQAAPGQTKGEFTISNISTNTGLTDIEQFRNMVVKAQNGSIVRVRDVGTVELGAENANSSAFSGGYLHTVFVGVQPTPSGNPLSIVSGVRQKMAELERTMPPALHMDVGFDSTKFIRASIHEVERTLAAAIAIVVIVIFLSLGTLRAVVIPIVTIPLSIVGAAALMAAAGFSINLLTLLAMVLAIGLVVDDAIVVVENVARHIEEGRTPIQAAMIGAREIIGPIIAMTVTLAAVYAPIGLLSGLTGSLFREFAFTLAAAVIISGVVALTLSPMMASAMLTHEMTQGRFAQLVERSYARLTSLYTGRLNAALNNRPAILLFAAVVLGSVYFLYTDSKTELAPPEDQGAAFSIWKAPQYANLDYVEAYMRKVHDMAKSVPEVENYFNMNGVPTPQNAIQGFLLKPWGERDQSATEIQAVLQQKANHITGLTGFVVLPPSLPGSVGGLPVQMVISSIDGYETIYRVMDELKTAARDSGLFIRPTVDSDLDFNNPVTHINIDRAKANELGVTMQSIGSTLAALVGENYVNRFDLNGRSYQVIPQVPRGLRLTGDDLTSYYVTTASGDQIPLSTLMTVDVGTEPNALTQFNQLNSATFQAVPTPGVTMGQAVSFLEDAAKRILPPEFAHDYLADSRQYVTEGNQLAVTFGFALIVIYLVLAAQFESLRDPLIVLVSVPMSICGALIPLFLGVATINIYTQIGLVTLIGLISKHGILMVTFANDMQRQENIDRRTAIEHAARVRLRPILMTTAAMVLGVVPLLIATGAGAASRFSIGLVIASGMTVGTLFTLFVLPTVYTFVAQDHRAEAKSRRSQEIAAIT